MSNDPYGKIRNEYDKRMAARGDQGGGADTRELQSALEEVGAAWEKNTSVVNKNTAVMNELRTGYDKRIQSLERGFDEWDKRLGRGNLGGGSPDAGGASRKEVNSALRSLLRGDKGPIEQLSIQNAMSVGVDPDGGYSVIPQLQDGISQILRDVSPFRRVARIQPIRNAVEFEERYTLGGAGASWVGETAGRPATSTPALKVLSVKLRELYSMPELTQKLIDSADLDITAWLNEQVGVAFAESEGTAFVNGDGILQPRGLLTYPTVATADSTRAWETLEHIVSGNASDFAATEPEDALTDMVAALKVGYRSRAVWMMNRGTAATISKFKDSQLRPLWVDSLVAGQPAMLKGFPVWLNEDFPDVAADAFPIAFGDFRSGYLIADGIGLKLLVDPFTNKPLVRLYTYRRIGGDVRDFNSLKLLKISA